MPVTFLPEKIVITLSTLAGASEEAKAVLFEKLNAIPLSVRQQLDLIRTVQSISELGGGLNSELGKVLVSMFGRMQSEYASATEFVNSLIEYLRTSYVDYFPDDSLDRLADLLIRLLSIEKLKLGQNAQSLHTEFERLFADARIMTDVRPLFSEDPKAPPRAAVLAHTLRIDFSSSSSPDGQLYFALDDSDLDGLLEQVKRAKEKSQTLKALLKQTNILEIE